MLGIITFRLIDGVSVFTLPWETSSDVSDELTVARAAWYIEDSFNFDIMKVTESYEVVWT